MKFENKIDYIVVFIYDKNYFNKNISDTLEIVFSTLEKYYKYKIVDSYNIKLYINKFYGIILEIYEDEITLENKININIKILKDVLFLYEVEDPLEFLDDEIYYYKDKYYINIKKKNTKILENSSIIYGKDVYKIIGKGIKIS